MPQPPLKSSQYRMVLIARLPGMDVRWHGDGDVSFDRNGPLSGQMQPQSGAMSEMFIGHWMGIITALFLFGVPPWEEDCSAGWETRSAASGP